MLGLWGFFHSQNKFDKTANCYKPPFQKGAFYVRIIRIFKKKAEILNIGQKKQKHAKKNKKKKGRKKG